MQHNLSCILRGLEANITLQAAAQRLVSSNATPPPHPTPLARYPSSGHPCKQPTWSRSMPGCSRVSLDARAANATLLSPRAAAIRQLSRPPPSRRSWARVGWPQMAWAAPAVARLVCRKCTCTPQGTCEHDDVDARAGAVLGSAGRIVICALSLQGSCDTGRPFRERRTARSQCQQKDSRSRKTSKALGSQHKAGASGRLRGPAGTSHPRQDWKSRLGQRLCQSLVGRARSVAQHADPGALNKVVVC